MPKATNQLYHAIGKSMLSRYAIYGANLASLVILARIFTPETFGAVASALVFLTFFQLVSEAGIGPAIINLKKLSGADRDGLFGLTIFIGALLAIAFAGLANIISDFYEQPLVANIVPILSFGVFFTSAAIIPNAFLLREQHFLSLAKAALVANLLSTGISILLSLQLDAAYSLAAKTPIESLILFFGVYYFSDKTHFKRPKVGLKFSAITPLLHFSGYQLAFSFTNYFSRNLDNILVAKYFGAATLGVYEKAYQIMRYPLTLLTFAMTPAIQPVISRIADDPSKVEEIHLSFTQKLSIAGCVTGALTYALIDKIVLILLGEAWIDVASIAKILSIAIPAQVIMSTSGSFFQAMSNTRLLFFAGVISAFFLVSATIYGIQSKSIITLSWALVLAFHLSFIQTYYFMYRVCFKKSSLYFFKKMLLPASLVASLVIHHAFSAY